MGSREDIFEKLRIYAGTYDGKFSQHAINQIGWAVKKLLSMPGDRKVLSLPDGTRIFLKNTDPDNPKIVIQASEVGGVQEMAAEKSLFTFPAPVISCYKNLSGPGDYYYDRIPDLFIVMPFFKKVSLPVKPAKTNVLDPEISTVYAPSDYPMWYGTPRADFWLLSQPDAKKRLRVNELWKVGKTDTSTIVGSSTTLINQTTYDPAGTNTTFNPPSNNREVDEISEVQYQVAAWGDIQQRIHYKHGHGWDHFSNPGGFGIWIQDNGDYESSGQEIGLWWAAITTAGIRPKFNSPDTAYFYIYEEKNFDFSNAGPSVIVDVVTGDTTNHVPVVDKYYMHAHGGGYSQNFLLWQDTHVASQSSILNMIDQGIFDFHGKPVFLISYTKTPAGGSPQIQYAMIFGGNLYLSADFTPIGSFDYPHTIPFNAKGGPYYASGYLRCVEIIESGTSVSGNYEAFSQEAEIPQ